MATLQHPTTVRNTIADTVVDLIDAGPAAGTLVFLTGQGGSALATLTFSDPAFNAAASGFADAAAITEDANTVAGTVAWFEVRDSTGTVVFEGDVTSDDVGGGAIQLSSVDLGSGDTLSVSSLRYTAPV